MSNPFVDAYSSALGAMENVAPKALIKRATLEAEDIDPDLDVSEVCLREYLRSSGPDDKLRLDLHLNLARWDNAPIEGNLWTADTSPNTQQRRERVIELLKLDAETGAALAMYFPIVVDGTTVIAGPWDPWYTPEVRHRRDFYWGHYVGYLRTHRKWGAEAIASLDTATTHVVERFIDPSRDQAGQTKGLVVGYVQSGKTANFTGVIAKAIDAGYRLIIVMTGTTNLLREQTQRRLDMELVGRENILRGIDEANPEVARQFDYFDDDDWANDNFVRLGVRPSLIDRPDIHRMTTRHIDYRRLQQGLPALEFERRDRTKPLWDASNLFASNARLIIVKKYSSVLENLAKDLKNTADRLEDIPALIIDDESDQASVNTTDPKKWEEEKKKRTAINKHISSLLGMLSRAQYVGYTATPFANVFVDPTDAEDIFPKDYLISLQRPDAYMGAEDFHDLDSVIPDADKTFVNSREKAHLRLLGKDDEDVTLRMALDSFVLAGAIKRYREQHGAGTFRHHTMLVHETMRRAGQKSRADYIKEMWANGGYLSGVASTRLRTLFDTDFAPVTAALAPDDLSPTSFADIEHLFGAVARDIAPHGNPVLIVNSDTDIEQEDLDFDKRPVWRVLVGGNKLARGFTVEGLTVTYYSRAVGHAEALMQMGRWFGFRRGYRDLVRLFITPGVRDAFEAACRDEEHFRSELRQYAMMVDGRPAVTPYDIPPLVMRHGLRPTAPNKMYNAQLVEKRTQTKEPSSGYPDLDDQDTLDRNIDACVPLLAAAAKNRRSLTSGARTFEAYVGSVTHREMVNVLRELKWATAETFAADLAWIARLPETIVDRWDIILPQGKSASGIELRGFGPFTIHRRKVERGNRIRGNSESLHRQAITELPDRTSTSGCVLLYPIMDKDREEPLSQDGWPTGVVMAMMLKLPDAAIPADRRPLVYQVVKQDKPLYAIVDK